MQLQRITRENICEFPDYPGVHIGDLYCVYWNGTTHVTTIVMSDFQTAVQCISWNIRRRGHWDQDTQTIEVRNDATYNLKGEQV